MLLPLDKEFTGPTHLGVGPVKKGFRAAERGFAAQECSKEDANPSG
jgi:hypothetical protein